jgi:hypothetical protein
MNPLKGIPLSPLLSLLERSSSRSQVRKLLGSFHCSRNEDVERFLHQRAITFEEKGLSRTYLWIGRSEGKPTVLAYFTIALKAIYLGGEILNAIKQLGGKNYKQVLNDLLKGYPLEDYNKQIPVYLIGQIGKHERLKEKVGSFIVKTAIAKIEQASKIVGGKIVILDIVEASNLQTESLIRFYKEIGFKELYLFTHDRREILRMYVKFKAYL